MLFIDIWIGRASNVIGEFQISNLYTASVKSGFSAKLSGPKTT